jgi:AmmeMemoRadiSam system protein B
MMDGQSEAEDIQRTLLRVTGGQIIPLDQIALVAHEADQCCLLDNARSAQRRLDLEREFEALAARPAHHAGQAYPADPQECRAFFAGLFDGLPLGLAPHPDLAGRPRGLIVPHIDLRVGGRTIARGLAPLDPLRPPRLYVILGVAHRHTRNLFTLTDKDFETPLGLVNTDRAAVQRLRALYSADRLDGARAHQAEHSVEFIAVALRHLHGDAVPFAILPILCGSLQKAIEEDGDGPRQRAEVADFSDALRALIAEYDGDVCVIASVDLSHVGIKFGEIEGVDVERAGDVREADQQMLRLVESMDPEGFFDHFRADANVRNVDAVTAVCVLLRLLGPGVCRLIDYQQWRETETDSMVTYASLAIY